MCIERNIIGQIMVNNLTNNLNENRNHLRRRILEIFLEEMPGTGKGENASRYRYYVENTTIGRIFLMRPAPLNQGFDFIINLENFTFSNERNNPTHDDVLEDLRLKLQNMPREEFNVLCNAINRVFNCEEPDEIIDDLNINYQPHENELPIDAFLKIIKWFFIEQDIRYWLYSGRSMLMEGLNETCAYK